MMRTIIATAILLILIRGIAPGQTPISTTKHNLSISGPGTIKAQTESQICVFCHTPHQSSADAQLWNHLPTTQTYTLYSSTYLTSKTYPNPDQPNAKSKLCMSCHDGTVALGSVYNTSGGGTTGSIQMSGGVTTMPPGSAGNLGTVLTNDHPVGFGYDNVRDPELVVRVWPWNTAVRLDPDASNGKVECHTCHDAHDNQYSSFLRMSNANAALCSHCHNKTNYDVSIHRTSTSSYTPTGKPATTVGEWSCRSCHTSHTAGGGPYTLRAVEQRTCYDGTNTGCHGSSAPTSNRIEPEMNKTWRHPSNTTDGLHVNVSGGESATQLGSSNRHAECQDCHNPHQAVVSVAIATRGNLRISGALKGTWGVEPTWPTPSTTMTNNDITWATPSVYARVTSPPDEYQVCLKCHSGYVALPVGKRDIAKEINPQYTSYHGIVPGGVTNVNVTSTTTNEPWGTNKRVWCSDCHGSESTTSPRGPHGSSLTGVGPGTANSDKMLVATIASSTGSSTPLCLVCHKTTSYFTASTGSRYPEHNRGNHKVAEGCFACHMWDHAGTTLNTGGKSEKIIAHGLNKRYYWRESGSSLTAGTRVMADRFNAGYISDMDYAARRCYTDADATRGCDTHTGGRTY